MFGRHPSPTVRPAATRGLPRVASAIGPLALALAVVVAGCSSDGSGGQRAAVRSATTVRVGSEPTTVAPGNPLPLHEVRAVWSPVGTLDTLLTDLAVRPGDPSLYVTDVTGHVYRIPRTTRDGSTTPGRPTKVLDLSSKVRTGGEDGMVGIVFSPDGTRMFLDYVDPTETIRLVELPVDPDGSVPAGATPTDVLAIKKTEDHHNGGELAFGKDGYLYVSVGDGGSQATAAGVSQDLSTLLGKILRIDPLHPDGDQPYSVPKDNPFVGTPGARPEVWALGMRNPWRFSFDEPTGDLWVADVGESQQEEIDRLPGAPDGAGRAANLGWNFREGTAQFHPGGEGLKFVEPALTYEHGKNRCAVIGGVVYRGHAVPGLDGAYLYGDFCSGQTSAVRVEAGVVGTPQVIATVPDQTVDAIEAGPGGEVYALGSGGGLFRLDPAPAGSTTTVPDKGPPTTTAATLPPAKDPASITSICGMGNDVLSFAALPDLPADRAHAAADALLARVARYRAVAPATVAPAIDRIEQIMRSIEAEVGTAGYDSPGFRQIESDITRQAGPYGDLLGLLGQVRQAESQQC